MNEQNNLFESKTVNIEDTLLGRLLSHAENKPNSVAYNFVDSDCEISSSLTYEQLNKASTYLANQLASVKNESKTVVLAFSQDLEFIVSYLACMKAGLISVPVSLPNKRIGISGMEAIVKDSGAYIILSTEESFVRMQTAFPESSLFSNNEWIIAGLNLDNSCNSLDFPTKKIREIPYLAMLQYTSGSTGVPKGVMVSHKNLMKNQKMIFEGFGNTETTTFGSWLPLYHDMGLIGTVLHSLYLGSTCYLMSPAQFIKRPILWLKMMSKYKITCSGAPNFGYDTCVKRIRLKDITSLDLSNWTKAYSGAEPIRNSTLLAFSDLFSDTGFKYESYIPCYGMAETTLYVTSRQPTNTLTTLSLSSKYLEQHCASNYLGDAEDSPLEVVGCGHALHDGKVKIVDPESHQMLESGSVGEIWVSGSHVTHGYWNRPEKTQEIFQARIKGQEGAYLRTGDLGFIKDGELFVTGRTKDLIILNGRNIYPSDIESFVEQKYREIVPSGVAAFQIENSNRESVVVVAESMLTEDHDQSGELIKKIRQDVGSAFGLPVSNVQLIKPFTLFKTTSGKVQRAKARQYYLTLCA